MNSIKHYLRVWGLGIFLATTLPIADVQASAVDGYEERTFDKGRMEEYRNNPKYQYHRDKPEPPKRKRKPREKRKIAEARPIHYSGPRGDFSGLAKGIIWVVIIGSAIFVLFQLLKVNWSFLWKKKSDKAKVVAEKEIPIEEDVTKMEFEDLLQKAIDAGSFRVAVRLLYLRALRQLSDQSQITWRKEKTNHEYIRELRDKNLRPGFSDVTLIFEYIWYGEFPVNKDDFNLARASFVQFEQTLRQHHAV
jgi:hypothetical protein